MREDTDAARRVAQVGVFFTEIEHSGMPNKYVPRSVQIDLEEGVCDRVSTFELPCHRHHRTSL